MKLSIDDKNIEVINKYQDDYPVKLVALSNELGISIYQKNLSKNISGAIFKNSDNTYTMYINKNDTPNRQRFTIAHEIAHYILHKDKIGNDILADNAMYRSKLSNVYERQANRLASEILIPIKKLRDLLFECNITDIETLAKMFKVSTEAMAIRIREGGNMFLVDD